MTDESPTQPAEPQPAAPRDSADEIAELRAQVAELRGRGAELEDRWRRAVADCDNLRKRIAREAVQQREEERARVASEWLPVLDNLELALEHAGDNPTAVVEGIRAVREQAVSVLERLGFSRSGEAGEMFDPARHDAVAVVPAEGVPAGTVVQVVRPGYGSGNRALRPAAVVVAKGE